jgi:Superoxide dismutase
MKYELPKLKYSYDALEPIIDKLTMEIHHTKHHAAYINNLNAALSSYPEWQDKDIEELLKSLDKLPSSITVAVRNNGGGHYNHTFFWNIMSPKGGGSPEGKLKEAIDAAFGSFDSFKEEFSKASVSRFGSGWAWLVVDKTNTLKVYTTANQDCPISEGFIPLLGLDVWEHAYYLNYQNRRADYISQWWNVVDWKKVESLFNRQINK